METVVIINPKAGNGRTYKIWPKIFLALKKSIGPFQTKITSGPGDAILLTKKALEKGAERIVAVGGDGVLNEVLNGFIVDDVLINPKACLSFVMTGTGCDFQRSFGISEKWEHAVENLRKAKLRKIDVGKVTYTDSQKEKKTRYFINIASFGISGEVDYYIENLKLPKFLSSKLLFLWATVKTVFTYPNKTIYYSIDGIKWEKTKTRLGLLANGRFFGGGMNAAPEAKLNDGLFDMLILKEISLGKFLWHFPKIYKGTHLHVQEIIYRKVSKFSVSSKEKIFLDIDGESPGYLDASFEVLSGILKLKI